MKKWLSLMAALLCFASILTGCGKDDKNSNNAAESRTEVTTVTDVQTTERSTNNSNDNGVVGDIVTDAEDMVDDIVTDAEDMVDDIVPTDSSVNSTEKTE